MSRRALARDPLTVMRKRILQETEVALLYGLRFPKRTPRIPVMEVGQAQWHPLFAARFWQEVLDLDECELEIGDSRLSHRFPT